MNFPLCYKFLYYIISLDGYCPIQLVVEITDEF